MSIHATRFALALLLASALGALAGYSLRRPHRTAWELEDPHDLAALLSTRGFDLRYVPAGTQGAAYLTCTDLPREALLQLPHEVGPAWKGTVYARRPPRWDEPQEPGERVGGLLLRGDPDLVRQIKEALRGR
jgi:hypothetical protein